MKTVSRRGLFARLGGALTAAAAGPSLLALGAQEAEAHHFCGHIANTGSCPHPTGIPRVSSKGYPLRAWDGRPVDDLGRPIDREGRPIDARGRLLRDADGRPLAPAPRSRICLDAIPERYDITVYRDGAWYRCCGGKVRKLMDCCAYSSTRINGDRAVRGYCRPGRTVFCVHYYQTQVPC